MKIKSLVMRVVTTVARRAHVQLASCQFNFSTCQNARRCIEGGMIVAAAAFLSLLPNSASAGVIYRWEDLSTNPGLGRVTGLIEINYAYWRPGGSLTISGTGYRPPGLSQEGNLLSALDAFVFGGNRLPDSAWVQLGHPFDAGQLVLTLDSTLKGFIYFLDDESNVLMDSGSVGSVWTIQDFSSDYPSKCFIHLCAGGKGLWVLDINSVPELPEPATLALLGFALGSLAISRRKNSLKPPSRST